MKKKFLVSFFVGVGISLFFVGIVIFRGEGNSLDEWDDTEKKVREFLPKLEALENKYPHDTEIQLGLAFLHSKYIHSPTVSTAEKYA